MVNFAIYVRLGVVMLVTAYQTMTQPTMSHAVVVKWESAEWAAVSLCRLPSSTVTLLRSAALRRFGASIIGLKSGCHFASLWSSATKARSRHDDLASLSVADAIVTSSPGVASALCRRSTTTEQRRRTVNERLTTRRRVLIVDTWPNVDVSCTWRRCRHRHRQLTAFITLPYRATAVCLIILLPTRDSTCSSNVDCSDWKSGANPPLADSTL